MLLMGKRMKLRKQDGESECLHLDGFLADEATAAAGDLLGENPKLEKNVEAGPSGCLSGCVWSR